MGRRLLALYLAVAALLVPQPSSAEEPLHYGSQELATLTGAFKAFLARSASIERVYMAAQGVQAEEGADQAQEPTTQIKKLLWTGRVSDGVLLTTPNLAEFEALATRHGGPTDAMFFNLLHRTYPDSHTPVYVTQTSDVSRCFNFAPGVFVPLYGDWLQFRKAHPAEYAGVVTREIAAIEHALMSAKCACTSPNTVRQSLLAFVKAYPKGEVTPFVEGRLDQIKRKRPDFHFDCMGFEQ